MHKKILLKTLTWRVIAISITTYTLYCFTGEAYTSFGIAMAMNAIKTITYFFHEVIWEKF